MPSEYKSPPVARRLREIMRKRGITTKEICARMGMIYTQFHRYLTGRTRPREETLRKICRALDIPEDYFD